jgi:hypothetical protein
MEFFGTLNFQLPMHTPLDILVGNDRRAVRPIRTSMAVPARRDPTQKDNPAASSASQPYQFK